MDKMDEIIWMIRQEMRRKKVHSTEIADVIGTSRDTVRNKLNGVCRFYADEIIKIFDYLGIEFRFREEKGEWK